MALPSGRKRKTPLAILPKDSPSSFLMFLEPLAL